MRKSIKGLEQNYLYRLIRAAGPFDVQMVWKRAQKSGKRLYLYRKAEIGRILMYR